MALRNTQDSYGAVTRTFHWLTAFLILTAIAIALYTGTLPRGSDEEVAAVARLFSFHKTIGVTAFFVALARILWALIQPKPGLLHPDRRLEAFLAEAVHWALYGAMVVMPLSGWLYHSATTGFAPILWPFGQDLPFVPKSERLAWFFGMIHHYSAKVLYLTIALHVAGALKHALIDRDGTLARMVGGRTLPVPAQRHSLLPAAAAFAGWALVIAMAWAKPLPARLAAPQPAAQSQATAGNWTVEDGTLSIALMQMGAEVTGQFTGWTADIAYDEAAKTGAVTVTIPVTGLSLGAVTQQALGPEFFDSAGFPEAVFKADIAETGGALVATGTLSLRGAEMPVTLPFTLAIDGDTARMEGQTTLDRRDFGMGPSYPDEKTVGYPVRVDVTLTAKRQ